MKTLLFHGPSGSGKDTQVNMLVEKYGFLNIGTGDMFRTMFEEGDEKGVKAHSYWSKGNWVPNELTYDMFADWLKRFDLTKDLIFVSTVRDIGQVKLFDEALEKNGRKLDKFIHFELSEEEAIQRLSLRTICKKCGEPYHPKWKKEKEAGICDKCGGKLVQREDDRPERIKERLGEYRRTIDPILEEYRNRGILLEIDASPDIETIHNQLVKELGL
jgi:adenylate kinase